MNNRRCIWYFIVGGSSRIWALYDEEKHAVGSALDWNQPTGLLGFIERKKDGSWDCFAMRYCGNEPNKKHAMEKVVNDLR